MCHRVLWKQGYSLGHWDPGFQVQQACSRIQGSVVETSSQVLLAQKLWLQGFPEKFRSHLWNVVFCFSYLWSPRSCSHSVFHVPELHRLLVHWWSLLCFLTDLFFPKLLSLITFRRGGRKTASPSSTQLKSSLAISAYRGTCPSRHLFTSSI